MLAGFTPLLPAPAPGLAMRIPASSAQRLSACQPWETQALLKVGFYKFKGRFKMTVIVYTCHEDGKQRDECDSCFNPGVTG